MRAAPFIDGDRGSHERELPAGRPVVVVADSDGGLFVVLLTGPVLSISQQSN